MEKEWDGEEHGAVLAWDGGCDRGEKNEWWRPELSGL